MADSAVIKSGRTMKLNLKRFFTISTISMIFILFFIKNKNSSSPQESEHNADLAEVIDENSLPQQKRGQAAQVERPSVVDANDADLGLTLSEADFASLADSLGNYDVSQRNEALSKFKEHALVQKNLDPIFSGLMRLSSDHPSFSILVASLAAVGTSSIQERLRKLLEQREGDWRAYAAIVPAFAFLQQPTSQTIEFLSRRSRDPDSDFSSTAALALGAIVRTLHVKGEAGGAALLQLQIAKLKDPNSRSEDIREALAVLGNAGLPETEGAIMGFLGSEDPSLRADAALALRFVSSSRSETALLERLAVEQDVETQMTVIEALVHRPVSSTVLAAVRSLLSAVPPAPPELREKALDLFFHSELSESEKTVNSEWLKVRMAVEPASSVKKKMHDVLGMLSQPTQR